MIGKNLTLSNISKRYGAVEAVRDTSLEIHAGEFVSIVGPSGSGKTSLLTMIAGFEHPSSGSIHIATKNITAAAPHRRDIGMVFQRYALFPHMTVRQNIEFPLRMRKSSRSAEGRRRVTEMLDLVQLGGLEHRYPHQLSGGQQQRVAVARALVFNPPVILMDEPLGALDKKLRESMQLEIKRIHETVGATVVYVTHDQEEALTMSNRVAVMHRGSLQQIGAPDELYRNPANAFVADFVGSINFLPVSVVSSDDTSVIVVVKGSSSPITISGSRSRDRPAIGQALRLGVRPEHLRLRRSKWDRESPLEGTVDSVVFAGASLFALVRIAAHGDAIVRVQLPAIEPAPERGALVGLDFAPEHARLFSAASEGAR
ncbi:MULTISPECIES: ABC transporter ATP-binding protein [unclassified Shinella]|uniref:ABC transporter ATP-binding protein n=1 Tax=unclassified Shinella TaxID=2643062 RepID=UPI00225C5629|nr:ABC transporter ATP-binding protein [Shinella sp. YE25]MDC7260151.1 ABC transporter ATP-binding protein [Shinella sp. YE25]CAI0341097.1 Spermidine/putrescine import ATP-binding protein PotA [Rhizobiaceae bacterium]CAK7262138.1 Spermidine/putrescine import ATP-binding protein PotA [Shinella sp. WSC3-e]